MTPRHPPVSQSYPRPRYKRDNWEHKFVNHSAEQYVRPDHLTGGPDIHVNGMENFWLNFKSSVRGTHVHISKGHA
jgi:transposase